VTSHTLSPGAIAGIVAGILLLVAVCAGLGYFYWKANKKVKRKNREVAILSDQVSGVGFQRRIDELLAESNDSTGTILRHKGPGSFEMGGASSSWTMDVVSSSSSVYSMDVARAM
jgi:phage-related minor tail protein